MFYTDSTPTGGGKTYHQLKRAAKALMAGNTIVFCQPSHKLIHQSYADLMRLLPKEHHHKVERILYERDHPDGSVVKRIVNFVNQPNPERDGRILFITHAALMLLSHFPQANRWSLIMDELPLKTATSIRLKLRDHRHLLHDFFEMSDGGGDYLTLEASNYAELERRLEYARDDDIHRYFSELYTYLRSPHYDVFADKAHWQKFDSKQIHNIEFHVMLDPGLFTQFRDVTFLSANFDESILAHYFRRLGHEFTTIQNREVRYNSHDGDRATIYWFSETNWSKAKRQKVIEWRGQKRSIGDIFKKLARDAIARDKEKNYGTPLWIANNDITDWHYVDGERLETISHGINSHTDKRAVIFLSALNASKAHVKFLRDMTHMTDRQLKKARVSQIVYQAFGRCNIRDPESDKPVALVVPDREVAEDLKTYYPNAIIKWLLLEDKASLDAEHLASLDRLTTALSAASAQAARQRRGRPAKGDSPMTSAERKRLQREKQKICHEINVKGNSFVTCDIPQESPLPISGYPPTCPEHLYITSNPQEVFIAQESLTANYGTPLSHGGFYLAEWAKQNTKTYNGQRFYDFDSFVELMQKWQTVEFAKKDDAMLLSPAHYIDPKAGHLNSNIDYSFGLFMDFDAAKITPDEVAHAFPTLTMVAVSSYSNAPGNLRYRICIPTTTPMTPEASHTILTILAHRIGGKRVGLDTGKRAPSSLFRVPSKRPHMFFTAYTENRKPLDPLEWLKNIPEELLPKPYEPREIPDEVDNEKVRYALEQWHIDGSVPHQGNMAFYNLTVDLIAAGLDDIEVKLILQQQASFHRHPQERYGEIDRAIKNARDWYNRMRGI